MSVFECVCVHAHVHTHMGGCTCGGQRLKLSVFLNCSLLYFFGTRVLTEPGNQQALGTLLSLPLQCCIWITGTCHSFWASISPTEPFLQPKGSVSPLSRTWALGVAYPSLWGPLSLSACQPPGQKGKEAGRGDRKVCMWPMSTNGDTPPGDRVQWIGSILFQNIKNI